MSEITKYVISVNPERAHIKKFPADLLNLQKSEILFIDASPELMHNLKSMSQEDVDGKLQEGKWVLKYKAVDKKKRPVPSTFPEVVTDNGPSLAGEFAKLAKEFNVKQIKISPYNSTANGIVERGHFNIREILSKACDGDLSQWPKYLQAAVFADRITTRRATGHSPFFLLHGVHPMLPCDLTEATFLSTHFTKGMSTEDLLAARE